jgi:hypothetical protein
MVATETGGYEIRGTVQRTILETMYKRHAADWAENINFVMDSEHIAIARHLLTPELGFEEEVQCYGDQWQVTREEATRQVLAKSDVASTIAGLAALVERVYVDSCLDVARACELSGVDRREAVSETAEAASLVRSALKQAKSHESLDTILTGLDLRERANELLPLVHKVRRETPCVHVLTTLGPGETETYVRNWLEEAMALYNVTKANGLEVEVQDRLDRIRSRIAALGRKIINELDLEAELRRIEEIEGDSGEAEAGRDDGMILKLIAAYSVASDEVGRLAMLWERQEEEEGKTGADYSKEPAAVSAYLAEHGEIEDDSVRAVVKDHDLEAEVEGLLEGGAEDGLAAAYEVVEATPLFRGEKVSRMRSRARRDVAAQLALEGAARGYVRRFLDEALALVELRREVLSEKNLLKEVDNPLYRYDAAGAFKKFHLLYTPSRVDLGAKEVDSVKHVPKWVGGLDEAASMAGRRLYSLYNVAGVTSVGDTRLTEFLKVGENFFSRGGPFYLSLTAGVNIDAVRMGDFEFFRDEWNLRGDRIVLPAGETYGGFCVPKEFTLLLSIISSAAGPKAARELLTSSGIPETRHTEVLEKAGKLLLLRSGYSSDLEWQINAAVRLSEEFPGLFGVTSALEKTPRLPQIASTLQRMGVEPSPEEGRSEDFRFADWVNKKAQGLEEINRSGPFRKVRLVYRLVEEARGFDSEIAGSAGLIGAFSASYKEGERENGREIPITDVRFSAGCRRLEIFSGTAGNHLLRNIDPEGRAILKNLLDPFPPPADLRIVGTCTGSDILNHVPNAGLEELKNEALSRLLDAGLDEGTIDANCVVYGGDLRRWAGVKDLEEEKQEELIQAIGGTVHLLVIERRGPYQSYEDAVQGIDFLDLGIPDPALLDLVDDLPRLLFLMKKGRPHSALAFADGTSGGRRRAFSFRYASSKRKVKELFALEERARYGALGLGSDLVAEWRREALADSEQAMLLYEAIVGGSRGKAEELLRQASRRLAREDRARQAAKDEINARRQGVLTPDYRYMSEAMGLVSAGMPLSELDYGTWLLLGGMYVLNGKAVAEAIRAHRDRFYLAMKKSIGGEFRPHYSEEQVEQILSAYVRPLYVPEPEGELRQVETGISGSLKVVEEKAARLAKRELRRLEVLRTGILRKREKGYLAEKAEAATAGFEEAYGSAKVCIGSGTGDVSPSDFGRFLAWAQLCFEALPFPLQGGGEGSFADYFARFAGRGIDAEPYQELCEFLARAAEAADGDTNRLDALSRACELLDIGLLLDSADAFFGAGETMVRVARFFDITLNSHVFDNIPYHYHRQRGVGYAGLDRRALLALCAGNHRWLYAYIRHLMADRTDLREQSREYQDLWLGNPHEGTIGIGIGGDDEDQRLWFSYVRLRDASVLWHEGFPLPQIFLDLDPSAIDAGKRTNLAVIYPHGNTTVPVALEQGARLASGEGVNLMLCAFPTVSDSAGRKALLLHDGFGYVSAEDLQRALSQCGASAEPAGDQREEGTLILAAFSRPVEAHGVFFHFTHPLRPDIDSLGLPVIQPLVWEAATHLKCRLPEMLEGSGVRTAEQINFFQSDMAGLRRDRAVADIKRKLEEFARVAPAIIVKPEKESGGRQAKMQPVLRRGRIETGAIEALGELVYTIAKSDNVVVQRAIPSRVRKLYSPSFLDDMVDRFAKIGVPVLLHRDPPTPLFSYFRQILILGKNGYEVSHSITVISTQGVANVGQGGLLYEYTDGIIAGRYRADLRREIRRAAFNSLESQKSYIGKNWKQILEEYLAIHPEFKDRVNQSILDGSSTEIPYEMGDYMPEFLVDENDCLVRIYDEETERFLPLFDDEGNPTDAKVFDGSGRPIPRRDPEGRPLPIPLYGSEGQRIDRFGQNGRAISTLVCLKIESNPGAGLWRPHNDQLPPERKGEGVFTIFRNLGQRAGMGRGSMESVTGSNRAAAPRFVGTTTRMPEKRDVISEAISRARSDIEPE